MISFSGDGTVHLSLHLGTTGGLSLVSFCCLILFACYANNIMRPNLHYVPFQSLQLLVLTNKKVTSSPTLCDNVYIENMYHTMMTHFSKKRSMHWLCFMTEAKIM